MKRAFILPLLLLFLTLALHAQAADPVSLSFADSLAVEGDHYRAITEDKRFLHHFPEDSQAPRARLSIAHGQIAGKQ